MKEVRQEEDVKLTVAGLSIVIFSRSDVVGLFFPVWINVVRFRDIRREETSSTNPHWLGLHRIGAIVTV